MKKLLNLLVIATFWMASSCESIVDDLNTDPNNPTNASTSLMLTGIQLANISIHEGHTDRVAGMWSGYFTGIARQYPDFSNYNVNGATFDQIWQNIYASVFKNGNVLISQAEEIDNKLLIAIVKITQAHALQTATSCWGDVPYSQISDIDAYPNPTFDPQQEVYESVQTLLDEAIELLNSGIGTSPGVADIHFGGNVAKWKGVAYTLKARAFLETRNYPAAYEAASSGISSAANSLVAPHGTVLNGNENLMYAFLAGGRAGDMSSKNAYITTLLNPAHANYRGNAKTDENARLRYYFLNISDPENMTPNTSSTTTETGIFARAASFPLITYEENLLILAEAGARSGGFETGLTELNTYRAYLNKGGYIHSTYLTNPYKYEPYTAADFNAGGLANKTSLPAADALLKEILVERYITFFGQKLGFSDLRRTRSEAVSVLIPPNNGNVLPERFIYSQSEVNSNTSAPNPVPGIFVKHLLMHSEIPNPQHSLKDMFMKKILVLFISILSIQSLAQTRSTGKYFTTRSETIARNGMAATSHPLATGVALDILKKGGNAIDAAIAANAVMGLVEPTGNGIGGDLFAIIWDAKTKKLYGLNASGRSPKSLNIDYFVSKEMKTIPMHGPLPVSVPGCVDGWYTMHGKFGTIPMDKLLAPAIAYAREGFPVTEIIANRWAREVPPRLKFPNFKETFTFDGKAPKKGEIFKNPNLANSLEKIGKGGRDVYYKGEIARTIDAFMKKNGGFLSYEDLAAHHSDWIEPVSTNYRGYDVWELPPNGQGIAVLQMLNILEAYDLKSMGFGSPEYMHLFIEAKKLAYADRAKFYADMDFNKIPVDWLISKEYAAERRKLINEKRAAQTVDAGELNQGHTIYLTTADKDGNMVSLIQSNYGGMGSGMVPDGLGFGLHNRGQMFNVKDKNHFNAFEPGKRPFSTIIPGFVTKDGQPFMTLGLMGGAIQPQGHAQIIINMLDFGMNVQEAGDAPRIDHSGSSEPTGSVMTDGGTVFLEGGFSYEVTRSLIGKGHEVSYGRMDQFGGYQAIMYDPKNKVYYGASESRKDGYAGGY